MIIIKIWGRIERNTSNLVNIELNQLNDNEESILILINSEGGVLSDAIAICNMLKAVPNKKITVAIGTCASAATMIFSIGKSRYIGTDVDYLIHQPLINQGNYAINYTENGRVQKDLKRALNIYKKYIINGTKIPQEIQDKAFKDGLDVILTPSQCIKYNIATQKFTTWNELYENENINIDEERTLHFDTPPILNEDEDEN